MMDQSGAGSSKDVTKRKRQKTKTLDAEEATTAKAPPAVRAKRRWHPNMAGNRDACGICAAKIEDHSV